MESILLTIIEHNLDSKLLAMSSWSPAEWSQWGLVADHVLAQVATMQEWAAERRAALTRHLPEQAADAAWLDFQCRWTVLDGFFDDTLGAGPDSIVALLVESVLETADDLNVEAAPKKAFAGFPDGTTGQLDVSHWLAQRRARFALAPGHMVVLGKALDLTDRGWVRNSPEFTAKVIRRLEDLQTRVAAQGRGPKPEQLVAPAELVHTAISSVRYLVSTSPHHIAMLQHPLKLLRAAE